MASPREHRITKNYPSRQCENLVSREATHSCSVAIVLIRSLDDECGYQKGFSSDHVHSCTPLEAT
jgi:hypothetical protein